MQKRDALSALKDGMVFDLFIFYIFYDKKIVYCYLDKHCCLYNLVSIKKKDKHCWPIV